ncbi:unnamed protein product [Euphydryas editha]|uniref:Uncharacterized protein n=1 Tax=Euphydryas editha TaxID=104508 RepID=A0AAU9TN94_EUPED|nr:unnamed protein product [Euphydryas editha]
MARAVETRASSRQSDMSLSDGAWTNLVNNPPEDPLSRAAGYFDLLQEICRKSRNLKGTSVKALNTIREEMKEIVQELANRNATEEVVQLRALVADLRKEKEDWKQSFSALEQKMERLLTTQRNDDWEERERSLTIKLGNMINARIEGLSDRLLLEKRIRPPLAADTRRDAPNPEPVQITSQTKKKTPEPVSAVSTLTPPANPSPAQKKKKKKGKKSAAAVEAATATRDAATTPAAAPRPPPKESWASHR